MEFALITAMRLLQIVLSLLWARAWTIELGHGAAGLNLAFDDHGVLSSLSFGRENGPLLDANVASLSQWSLQFVNAYGIVYIDSVGRAVNATKTDYGASLVWQDMRLAPSAVCTVTLDVHLSLDSPSLSEWTLSTSIESTTSDFGLWQASIAIPTSAGNDLDGDLFFPGGFGYGYHNPAAGGEGSSTGGALSADYPSGGASMQYMAIVSDSSYSTGDRSSSATGVYVGAHDGLGYIKQLNYQALPDQGLSLLNITMIPKNAGTKMKSWSAPYPVVVGVIPDINDAAGKPLWYQAAQIYRNFIESSPDAPWARQGISSRVPDWYRSSSLWVNSHWQCQDIFNATGGDPRVVLDLVSRVADLVKDVEPSLLFHWYEWQQGPHPSPEERYLFDTHYPDYFPSRKGFSEVVDQLYKEKGVRTFPYINGRIFDQNSDSYKNDDGAKFCSKEPATTRLIDNSHGDDLTIPTETYGSGATFCVASPFTPYWQNKIADTSMELLEDYHVHGVYIDQVGAAGPVKCWDEEHGHSLGGGTYWNHGYDVMLGKIDERKADLAPIVTEDCAEPYMHALQGNLILTSFKSSLAQGGVYSTSGGQECAQSFRRLLPAYPAVYGGKYVAFGAEWFVSDFRDGDWFCGKLSSMLVVGAQLGWFSLSGNNNPGGDDSCGPMGVGELLLSENHAAEVSFLKLLAYTRRQLVDYLVDGRLLAPPVLTPAPLVLSQSVESKGGNKPLFDYDAVSRAHWSLEDSSVVILTNNLAEESYTGVMKVAEVEAGGVVSASLYSVSESKVVAQDITLTVGSQGEFSLPPRSVLMVRIA